MIIIKIILCIAIIASSIYLIRDNLHILQLKGYKLEAFFEYKMLQYKQLLSRPIIDLKVKLHFTPRAKRIYILSVILCCTCTTLSIFWARDGWSIATTIACVVCIDLWSGIAVFLLTPIEKIINLTYIKKAKLKLSSLNCQVVGITGSVGKTSVKNILYHLIKGTYKTVATPKSYNTTLGVTRSILNRLSPTTQVFIAEMGAKNIGDISELCSLTHPQIGILTNISPAHMQYFKTLENIVTAKSELVSAVEKCVFNIDNEHIKKISDAYKHQKISISIQNTSDLYASDIKVGEKTEFTINYLGHQYATATLLLGEHNVLNILLAVGGALLLGMPIEKIIEDIPTIPTIPHRLQITKNASGVNIIDDTYNASPESVSSALKVLQSMSGRKIVATPGIVEGGEKQYEYNHEFGEHIAHVADILIIINRTNRESLQSGASDMKNIYIVNTLSQAKDVFAKILKHGDNLLLINDLPDDYS